jgi:hypothetical protein
MVREPPLGLCKELGILSKSFVIVAELRARINNAVVSVAFPGARKHMT